MAPSVVLTLVLLALAPTLAPAASRSCEVYAKTLAGLLCGVRGRDARGAPFASFKGVPYAAQPVGERRFMPLQPVEPWRGVHNATREGPICPQTTIVYGRLMQPQGMSEACIHANIHTPLAYLPDINEREVENKPRPPYMWGFPRRSEAGRGLPVLVFIHGGGFGFGSGDADLHGPENLVAEGMVVITFNYRLNIFGFLSLNSTEIPGNNGLRDMVTLLRWVQLNVRFFGGNPDNVTLAGHSAGAASAHLLSLSPAAEGLFHKVILMSGTAIPSFYTTSPLYASSMAQLLLNMLGINHTATTNHDIHRQLIDVPLATLVEINNQLQRSSGLVTFLPVIESPHPGVERILDMDTETAIANGRGKDLPMLVGYTNVECEVFRHQFEDVDILSKIEKNPLIKLPVQLIFTSANHAKLNKIVDQRYYRDGPPTIDNFIKACTEMYFQYPALKVAEYRHRQVNSAPAYLYEFAYSPDRSVLKEALNMTYEGAAHAEDLTFLFKVHSVPVKRTENDLMVEWMINSFVRNFIFSGKPNVEISWTPALMDRWVSVREPDLRYQLIDSPNDYKTCELTEKQKDLLSFFEELKNAQ